jgi:internalin A
MSHRLLPFAVGALLLAAASLRADDAEDQAERAIEKLGGKVVRDDKDPAKPVIQLDLANSKLTDEDLNQLAGLKRLQTLNLLNAVQVTEAGLKELAALKELQTLHLWDCGGATDEGLKELAALKSLRQLFLAGANVSDAGLKHLAGLKELRELNLNSTALRDADKG